MIKLNQGPSCASELDRFRAQNREAAWETIQPQTKEYAQLAADLAKARPTQGLEGIVVQARLLSMPGLRHELDKAAQAKDKAAATAAQRRPRLVVQRVPSPAPRRTGR